MIRHSLFRFLALSLLLVALSACATKPIAKQYRQEAKAEDLTFPMVLQNPDAYLEAIVLWGGVIIETKNLKEGTEMIVLETPLGRGERPKSAEYTLSPSAWYFSSQNRALLSRKLRISSRP